MDHTPIRVVRMTLGLAAVVVLLLYATAFINREGQATLVNRLGKPVRVATVEHVADARAAAEHGVVHFVRCGEPPFQLVR